MHYKVYKVMSKRVLYEANNKYVIGLLEIKCSQHVYIVIGASNRKIGAHSVSPIEKLTGHMLFMVYFSPFLQYVSIFSAYWAPKMHSLNLLSNLYFFIGHQWAAKMVVGFFF